MRVFLTGATGFIGSAIVKELMGEGHRVLGLARSDEGAAKLNAVGAEVQRGSLEDLESLRDGADAADAVIHTAFIHDFSKYKENCETDRRVIDVLGTALSGSGRPLIVTSGTGMANIVPGRPALESNPAAPSSLVPRSASEEAVAAMVEEGSDIRIVRLPQVHDPRRQGLVTYAIQLAKEKRVSAYVGDGTNRWPAAHVLDTARLYRLVLEKGSAGGRYHAVAEEGVPVREIAEAIARGLKIPVVSLTAGEAEDHFGWLAMFAGRDVPASSAQTRAQLDWRPVGPGLIADLDQADYIL